MHDLDHLRAKAVELRSNHQLSLDEIVERLGLPRTPVYYWIKDIPLGRSQRLNHLRASEVNQENARKKREDAYQQGITELPELLREPTFRDFVVLYMAEGLRRDRNAVSLVNTNPIIVKIAHIWLSKLSRNKVDCVVQIHADHEPETVRDFWANALSISKTTINIAVKSNSGQLAGRQWRSIHGVCTVRSSDTYLRARLQAWMDKIQEGWYTHFS